MRGLFASALACVLGGAAWASQAIDGVLDAQYGAPRIVQNCQTGFGNSTLGTIDFANGSELVAGYGYIADGNLYLFFPGNLESNDNKLEIFIDCHPLIGQNRVRGDNGDSGLNRMGDSGGPNGLKFDAGFAADYWIAVGGNRFPGPSDPYSFYADLCEMPTTGGGAASFLGRNSAGTDAAFSGGTNPWGIKGTIDNSNVAGVASGAALAFPSDCTTGIELCIPLTALGNPTGSISVCAFINASDHSFMSNQVLAGLGASANLGEPRGKDFSTIGGFQYFTVSVPFTPGNLAVSVIHDGNGLPSNVANAVYIREYTTAGSLVQEISLPNASLNGHNACTSSGSATSEGFLKRSTNKRFLTYGGYSANVGTLNVAATTSARVVARVDSEGLVDTSTSLATGYSGSNIRSAVSSDGADLWTSGTASSGANGGVRYATVGGSSSTQTSSTVTNIRVTDIFDGQLYCTSASGSFHGLSKVGTGLPTGSGETITILPGFSTTSGPSSYDFFFADASTVYVMDDRASGSGGGIQKWRLEGGSWVLKYTFRPSFPGTVGGRGITGTVSAGVATLYVVDVNAATSPGPNVHCVTDTITDTIYSGSGSVIVAGLTNRNHRGIALVPEAPSNSAPTLTVPADATLDEGDTFSDTATATDPDTGQTLTFSKVSGPAALTVSPSGAISWSTTEADGPGVYTVTIKVEDDGSPVLSDTASFQITVNEVNQAPVLDPVGNQTVDEGDLLTFTATATDADLPANTLTFSLAAGVDPVPPGASISVGGVFTWTPTEAQGPGTYTFKVVVTDDGTPALSDEEEITITVNEVNQAPVLDPIGDQAVDEGTLLTFTATASDPDDPANTLTFSLDAGAPAGASITPAGVFTWTPTEAQGPGVFTVTIRVTDDGAPALEDFETIQVTVNEVNQAPVLDPVGNQSVDEGDLLTFTATASDADLPANTLTFSLAAGVDPVPPGASISAGGVFTWTPTEAQGPGTYTFKVVVTDDGTPALSDEEEITITVNEVNQAPVLDPIGDQAVDEGTLLTFTATASDPDDPANTLTFSLDVGAPAGASITPAGVFTWTPTEAQGPGVFTITIRVTDDGVPALDDFETIQVTVNEVNQAPVLDNPGTQNASEHVPFSLQLDGSDADLPAQTLTFAKVSGPAALTVSASGLVEWTPGELDGGTSPTVTVSLTDGVDTVQETFTIDVAETNQAPVLDPVGDQTVDEGTLLTFTATASDPDDPANTLTFSLDAGAPAGASITPAGVFTWTPTEAQGPGVFTVTIRVTDDGVPALDDFETIQVTVNEVNQAPVLDNPGPQNASEHVPFSLQLDGSDADLPAQTLTFAKVSGPAALTVSASGLVEWTPGELDGGTAPSVTVSLSDGVDTVQETFTIDVAEVNAPPVWAAIPDQSASEHVLFTLDLSAFASDADDVPANLLTYSLVSGPAGLTVSPLGLVSWTPGESDGGTSPTITVEVTDDGVPNLSVQTTFVIDVAEINAAPVLDAIGDQTVDEGVELTFTATATDPDDPANTLTFSLAAGVDPVPAGAIITAGGVFTWTPTEAQGPGAYTFKVVVTDDGDPALSDEEEITITVNEVNLAPVLDAIGNKSVQALQTLSFTATASDPDLPANGLTFSLDAGAPTGAAITPTGDFTWTPTEAQPPGVYSITIRVTDDGDPALDDSETIQVTVTEVPEVLELQLTLSHADGLVAAGPVTRGLIIRLGGTGGPNAPLVLDRDVEFDENGNATLTFTEADGLTAGAGYTRLSVKDPLHSLRTLVELDEPTPDVYTGTGALRSGNLNKDHRIDIGDYVVFALRFGTSVSPHTPFDIAGPPPTHTPTFRHADLNGDGEVDMGDYAILSARWGQLDDDEVGNFSGSYMEIRTRISVIEAIAESGTADAMKLDLDGDGWITMKELGYFVQ